jgi:hypothetical protein
MTNPAPARSPKAQRSRVSNGSVTLPGVDGRSATARRFKELYRFFRSQAPERDAEARQLASLILQREALDAAIVRGEPVDIFHLVRLAGAINRTLARLQGRSGRVQEERK